MNSLLLADLDAIDYTPEPSTIEQRCPSCGEIYQRTKFIVRLHFNQDLRKSFFLERESEMPIRCCGAVRYALASFDSETDARGAILGYVSLLHSVLEKRMRTSSFELASLLPFRSFDQFDV